MHAVQTSLDLGNFDVGTFWCRSRDAASDYATNEDTDHLSKRTRRSRILSTCGPRKTHRLCLIVRRGRWTNCGGLQNSAW